ncbi:MAG: alpha/beta hydrolase [Paracoccaceae bacterium]
MTSLSMRVVNLVLRLGGKPMADAPAYMAERMQRDPPQPADIPERLRRGFDFSESEVGGHRLFTVTPRERGSETEVLYLHGGIYVNPLRKEHWNLIAAISKATGARITVPIYPLAPEHGHAPAHVFVKAVYARLLEDYAPENIVFAGDSAGGGLALALAMAYRDQGAPLPARLVLFAPWLDITSSNPDAIAMEPKDPMIGLDVVQQCGVIWADGSDLRAPHLSPMFGALEGLPPIEIHQGTNDVCLPDARLFAGKQGAEITLYEYPGAPHVFVAAPFTREAKLAMKRMAAGISAGRAGV